MLLRRDVQGRNFRHIAPYWGKLNIVQKIWVLSKERLTTEDIKNEMILPTDHTGQNNAVFCFKLDVMQKIWEWAKERLTTEEIRNDLLLCSEGQGKNV